MVVKANLSCEQEDTVAEGVVQLSKELKPGNSHSLRKIKAWSTSDKKMVFLTNESANKAEINILSARDTTRPGP